MRYVANLSTTQSCASSAPTQSYRAYPGVMCPEGTECSSGTWRRIGLLEGGRATLALLMRIAEATVSCSSIGTASRETGARASHDVAEKSEHFQSAKLIVALLVSDIPVEMTCGLAYH